MKLLIAVLALISFGIFVPNMYADNLNLDLTALGAGNVSVVGIPVVGAEEFLYNDTNVNLLSHQGLLEVANFNFDATLADVAGIETLAVTESCVIVDVLHHQHACDGLAFAFTNLDLGNVVNVIGSVGIGADVNLDVVGADVGASIGGGTADFQFGNPPPSTSPTPEPGTLSLMGTGLLGVAGVIRRKFRMA